MAVLKCLGWCIAIPFALWLKAIVGVDLWEWFVVPFGAPAIGLAHALGISLLGWFWVGGMDHVSQLLDHADERNGEVKLGWVKWATMQVMVLIVWGYGAIFHRLMA